MTISSIILSIFKFIEEFFRITWLSVSSTKFYPDLYKKYNGYGLKFITMAIALTSIAYSLFMYDAVATIRRHLIANTDDANPVEHILNQWPEVKYDGKEISLDGEDAFFINTISGKVAMAIDPENKLTLQQNQTIPVILQKQKLVLNFMNNSESNAKPNQISLGYKQIFSSEPNLLNQAVLKTFLLDILEPIGFTVMIIVIPVLSIIRLLVHIASSLFSMVILFGILWWLKLKPTPASVSRVVLFSSAASEMVSPILLIFAPSLLFLASFVEYWAIILAVYSLSGLRKEV